jgi:predicted PurR-regulated permease PerM
VTTREHKAIVRYAMVAAVLTAALTWTLFLVRDALLIVYISALVAIGLSPLVEAAEQRITLKKSRIPRWAAILGIYCSILGILVGACSSFHRSCNRHARS